MLCCGCRSIHRDGGYESIPSPRQGLDEARIFRRIAQRLANLVDSAVQVVVNINESVGPQSLLQVFSSYHLARAVQQNAEHLKRLPWQLELDAGLAQFLRLKVNFKRGKANYLAGADLVWHRWIASSCVSLAHDIG